MQTRTPLDPMMASIRQTRTAGHVGWALAGVALVLALAPGWATAEPALAVRGDAAAAALPPLLLPAQWSQVPVPMPVPMPGQVPEQVSAVDAGWSSSGSAPTEVALWWRGFGDRELMARVEQALRANTSVRSALAAVEQARALRDVAQAGRWPEVGASASVQRSRSGDAAVGNSWRAGLDAAWDPDLAGRQRASISAGEAELQAARYGLEQARVELAAEVALSYIELRGLQARLAIARANLAAQQDTLQITDWRVQAGLASSLDLEQARAATEQTRAQIPALRTSLSKTAHALALLGGQMPAASQTLLETVRPVPLPPAGLVLSFPAETMRQRADLRAAEQRVLEVAEAIEAAESRIREAARGGMRLDEARQLN
ncbi:TolC family protein, partial [Malikia spinosa]|uniref:TolC family protein n=1 Tax=Malikia spinosa TaxID=86180 RepID=UPI001EEE1FC7